MVPSRRKAIIESSSAVLAGLFAIATGRSLVAVAATPSTDGIRVRSGDAAPWGSVRPGDSVLFERGGTWRFPITVPHDGVQISDFGDPTKPAPLFDGLRSAEGGVGGGDHVPITITGRSGVTISDIRVRGSAYSGIHLTDCVACEIRRVESFENGRVRGQSASSGNVGHGVLIEGARSLDNRIEGCNLHHNAEHSIQFVRPGGSAGRGHRFIGNHCHHNIETGVSNKDATHILVEDNLIEENLQGGIIVQGNSDQDIYRNNVIRNVGAIGIGIEHTPGAYHELIGNIVDGAGAWGVLLRDCGSVEFHDNRVRRCGIPNDLKPDVYTVREQVRFEHGSKITGFSGNVIVDSPVRPLTSAVPLIVNESNKLSKGV